MRALCLLLLFSGALFAQDQPQPSGKFYGPLATHSGTFKPPTNPPKFVFKVPPEPPVAKSAIQLVEMNIPSGTNFVIGTITPKDPLAAGSEGKSLLPPCSQQ